MATSKTTNTYNRQNWEDAVIFKYFVSNVQRCKALNLNRFFRNFQYYVKHVSETILTFVW